MKQIHAILLLIVVMTANAFVEAASFGSGSISRPSTTLDGVTPTANWIWNDGPINPENTYVYMRKTITLDNPVKEASAYISAHSFAQLYINGKLVDRVPVKSDPNYQMYDHFDLTAYFTQGENTIAALVYNYGVGMHHHINARGGFFFQGQVNDSKGNVTTINTDKTWRVETAGAWDTNSKQRHVNHLIGFREIYDARKANPNWNATSFDDSSWQSATEIGIPPVDPWNGIIVTTRPPLARKIIEPANSWESKGYHVYDFDTIYSACLEITIDAEEAGIELQVGTAEKIDADRFPRMTQELDYTDTYITTKGKQTIRPVTWRGFRYIAVENNPKVSIEGAVAESRSYPLEYKGAFTCSDRDLSNYWSIGRWTLQICSQDTLMDTPWREQTQYIAGDSRYDMRYGNYAFGPEAQFLFKYNILSGAFSQDCKGDGSIRSRYPTDWLLGPTTSTYIPDYELEWVLMVQEYYLYYADEDLVKRVYPRLIKLMNYFETYINPDHQLLKQVPGWVVLDHPDTYRMDVNGENTAMNCLYVGALNSAAYLAKQVMGDGMNANKWQQTAATVNQAVNEQLFSEKDGVYKDGLESDRLTQQTQVYALKYGLVADEHKASVIDFVKSKKRSCEQSFSYWLTHAMFAEGEGQWVLDYIRTYWGGEVTSEGFNGAWREAWSTDWGSSSHAWCAGPTALLPEKVLGIEPVAPGWSVFTIKPDLCDLQWANAVVPTVAGEITVKVRKINKEATNGMQLHAVVPNNTTALLYVPVDSAKKSTITVNKQIVWKDGSFIKTDQAISYQETMGNYIVFKCQPGSYMIASIQ